MSTDTNQTEAVGTPVDQRVGRLEPERAGGLAALIADLERQQFDQWARDNTGDGKLFSPGVSAATAPFYFAIWRGGFSFQRPCRGVKHNGCEYLSPCGGVCNKCGQST